MTRAGFSKLWPWLASAAGGAGLAFCFAPWNVSEIVWFWQVPIFFALWFGPVPDETRRWRRGFGLGYAAGLAFFLVNLHWLFEMRKVGGSIWAGIGAWLALPAYLALYLGAWGAFAATVGRWRPDFAQAGAKSKLGDLFGPSVAVIAVAALNAAAWCGLEWLRARIFGGFGWNGLGVALHGSLYLIQLADTVGATGLAFPIVFCNAVWTATLVRIAREMRERGRPRPHLDFAVAVCAIMGLFLYGLTRLLSRPAPEDTVELRTLVMQMNIPIDVKEEEDLRQWVADYEELTRAFVESSDYDLVLWPETALPGRLSYPWVRTYLNDHILRGDDFSLMLGIETDDFDEESERIYNSAVLLKGSTMDVQIHRKLHLVPFGEYIPWRRSFPVFDWIAGGLVPKDFTPGENFEPLTLTKRDGETVGIVPLVCFEDTMGRLARRFVRPGPQLMVNVTNDAWFYQSPLSAQHLANAKLRCVELRRPMARAANTGVSAYIDETGSLEDPGAPPGLAERERLRVIQDPRDGNTFVRGTLPGRLRLSRSGPVTFFARFGDVFSLAAGLVAALFAGRATGFPRWGRKRARP